MRSQKSKIAEGLERAIGEMMRRMSLDYRLRYGRTCKMVRKVFRCGHAKKALRQNVLDCWRCAQLRPDICQPNTTTEEVCEGECCSACTIANPNADGEELKKAMAKQRKLKADRDRMKEKRIQQQKDTGQHTETG